jgi:chromosome partitioning protein
MGQIVAISNQKGGVAKTTTCLSLGACLAELGQRTLVVDLDSQANLTLAAGLDPDVYELEWTLSDLLEPFGAASPPFPPASGGERGGAVIQPTLMEGLDILPADVRLASVERWLNEQDDYETILAQILELWQADGRRVYDYILLDCPPSLSPLTLMALTAAQSALIPVQCEYYAARGLSRMLDVVAAVRERTNPDLTCHLLATLYDQRNRICQGVLAQLRVNFPDWLLDTVIGVDTRLRECPAAGEPIILYDSHTRASRQYRQLAREFHARIGGGQTSEMGHGLTRINTDKTR